MRLQTQLLLVGMVTLLLPWAGCQTMLEVEAALRSNQQDSLAETATSMARVLSHSPYISPAEPLAVAAPNLYLFPLAQPPVLDGYGDDWLVPDNAWRQLPERGQHRLKLLLGASRWDLWLMVRKPQPAIRYHKPGDDLASSDGLLVQLEDSAGSRQTLLFRTSAPGQLHAEGIFATPAGDRFERVPGSYGYWQEVKGGWQVELRIPDAARWQKVAVVALSPDLDGTIRLTGSWHGRYTPAQFLASLNRFPNGNLVRYSPALAQQLATYGPGFKLTVIDASGFVLASSGSLTPPVKRDDTSFTLGIFRLLYELVIDERWGLADGPEFSGGQLQGNLLTETRHRGQATRWYKPAEGPVTVAATHVIPNTGGKNYYGDDILLVERSTERILSLTNAVWLRLFKVTLLVLGLVLALLLGYASLLSWRIRKLRNQVERVISPEGRLLAPFKPSDRSDEIGDLSRGFGLLHGRLQEYTDYLQGLSSKLAHELRTPLAVIRSSLDNLEMEALPESAKEYTDRANEGVNRLRSLIDAMSEARRVEQVIAQAEEEWFPLDQLVSGSVRAYADVYTKVQFKVDITSGNYDCYADPHLVVQLMDKLVDNAADFAPKDAVVEVALRPEGEGWLLTIFNPGPLLPEQMQGRLFDSMVSLRLGHSDRHHLGFGLYIVRLIAESMGGQVQGRNDKDRGGVCFSLWLPLSP